MTATTQPLRPRASLTPGALGALAGLTAATGAAVAYSPVLAGCLVFLAAFAVVTVLWPDFATLIVVGLLFANVPGVAIQNHGAPVIVGAIVPLLLVVPAAALWWRGERLIATPAFVLLVVLLLCELASTLLSDHQTEALDKMRTFIFEAAILYFLASNVIRTPDVLRKVLWVVLGATTFLALLTIFQDTTRTYFSFYGGFALPDPSYLIGKATEPRASGPVGDPNYYAQILIVANCIGLVFAWRSPTPVQRILALGATAAVTYAILLTFSRGTMLALFFVILVLAAMRYFKGWQILTMILAIVVVFASVPAFSERLSSISAVGSATEQTGTAADADQSAQGRATEMLAAFHVFQDHPAFGVGPANFPLYYRAYAEQIGGEIHDSVAGGAHKGEQAERQAHNMLISQLAELGIIGTTAFVAILIVTLRALMTTRRRLLREGDRDRADLATILLLAVLSYLFCGIFLTLAFERYFWLLLGIAGGATSLALRTPPGPAPRRRAGG